MRTWRLLHDYRSNIALENETMLAGCALACAYSSSDEYEAAIIAERRAAGMYRSSPWPAITAGVVLVAAVILVFQF